MFTQDTTQRLESFFWTRGTCFDSNNFFFSSCCCCCCCNENYAKFLLECEESNAVQMQLTLFKANKIQLNQNFIFLQTLQNSVKSLINITFWCFFLTAVWKRGASCIKTTFMRALKIQEKSQFQRNSTVKFRCVCHKDLHHEVTLSPPWLIRWPLKRIRGNIFRMSTCHPTSVRVR